MVISENHRPRHGEFARYGYLWDENVSDLTVELFAFRKGLTEEEGGLGKVQHAKNIYDMLWNRVDSMKRFEWTPWAEKMLERSCRHQFLAVAGCASSGKSDFFACWGIINFLCDPTHTMVLVTSTSLKDSKKRIFGEIVERWNAVPGLPGKVVDSLGMIKFFNPETGKTSEQSGIALIAGDPTKDREAVRKLIGFKNRRVLLIADELPDLSESILQAALGNLSSNPEFQMIGIGNPASHFDPFGVFSKPKEGWKSICPLDEEWETEYGWCLRFDVERSPNYLERRKVYDWMYSYDVIKDRREKLGADSPTYWRMFRGFWCPSGASDGIYSEGDFAHGSVDETVKWADVPKRVASLDASFAAQGDRAVALFGRIGKTVEGKTVLLVDKDFHVLTENVNVKDKPRDFQIAEQFMDLCRKERVDQRAASIDSTGAGGPFASILSVVWSPDFHRTYFGGAASNRPVSSSDKRLGNEAYENRVTELWFAGKELLRTGQLKGMPTQAQKEMCARHYVTRKKGAEVAMEAESKVKMKARIGMSPDVADAVFILVELCRERFNLVSTEGEVIAGNRGKGWDQFAKEINNRSVEKGLRSERSIFDGGTVMPRSTGFLPLRRV